MNFLAPWYLPAIAAAATVPPLVLLYFLKLKRRELPIASTLLWRKAIEDLQVNSPFQRLRNNLLLILQILVLLAAVLAIGEPMISAQRGFEKALVLMIDHSGSMAAREGDATRLELAKREALAIIEEMRSTQRAMIIAFADRARVLSPFTDDKQSLRQAVNSIAQSDAPGQLTEAMALAEAHSTPVGEVGDVVQIAESQYVVLTDGRLADAADTVVRRGTMEIIRIGTNLENVGIVNLDARRHYEQPEQITVLARVKNFGTKPVTRDVSIYIDDDLKGVQTVELAPMGDEAKVTQQTFGEPTPEAETNVTFDLTLDVAARLELRLSGNDDFSADDRVFGLVTAPRPVSVLLVTPGNRYLRQILPCLPVNHFEVWTPDEYEKKPDADLIADGRCKFDVVILDGHSTARLPPGSYMFFGAAPLVEGVDAGESLDGRLFLDWDDTHPILRHVAVAPIRVFSWLNLVMPKEAVTLIHGHNGPVLSLLARDRRQYLVCAFGLFDEDREGLNTDWVLREGFVIYMYNSLRYLAGASTSGQVPNVSPGSAFEVGAKPGSKSVTVYRPDGKSESVPVLPNHLAAYGRTDRVGMYTIPDAVAGDQARAVNLLNETESWIAPNEQFTIAAGQVEARTGQDRVNRPLWPYLLVAMAVLLAIEWAVYSKRVFV